ncbi:MAG: glycosyltransferase family 4 protein [Hyphomonadaceae bacterium]|nr:glycosyltransferase family 4 protein [Hyphomonadaceae bacterium]
MRIVMADSGVAFDGLTPLERPLGGAESAFIALAEALAQEGADVTAYAAAARPMTHAGVRWRPNETLANVRATRQLECDLFIANRDPALMRVPLNPRRLAFWLHNPATFLSKPRFALRILAKRPTLVFAGPAHAATAPFWARLLPCEQIPLGVEHAFLETRRAPGTPPPRAVFASNPLRGLAPLTRLWRDRIRPAVPDAELHVFSGPQVYAAGGARSAAMRAVLAEAAQTPGVIVREPVAKPALAEALGAMRAMLYLGDPGETFCLAVAEAQAMGAPAIVRPVGAVGERVEHGITGTVAGDDKSFADAAIRILTDDALWARQSRAALARRATLDWRIAARRFLALAPAEAAAPPELPQRQAAST